MALRQNDLDRGGQVAEALAKRLFTGDLVPGSVLPTELTLCDHYDVGRSSIRDGLQRLAAAGIITRTAGSGTHVNEYADWNILDPVVSHWIAEFSGSDTQPNFVREIFEFRYTAEPYIASLAAERATARDLLHIEEALDGMRRSVRADGGSDLQGFSHFDMAFHEAIYRASHNVVWAQLAHVLRPSIRLVIRRSSSTADELEDSLSRHANLMEQIRLRAPAAAHQAAVRVMQRTAVDLGIEPATAAGVEPGSAEPGGPGSASKTSHVSPKGERA